VEAAHCPPSDFILIRKTIAGATEQFKSTALNADMLRKMTLKEFGLSDEGDPL